MWKDVVIVSLMLILAVGCHLAQKQGARPESVAIAVTGVAGIEAHTNSAERHVQNAVPHTSGDGKVLLKAASEEHKEVLVAAAETREALTGASGEIEKLQEQLGDEQSRFSSLEAKWYVTWGRRVERALWVIGIGWLACGIASVVFGLGNPLSGTWRVGKEITRLVPAMNLFSWVRDWILSRRNAAAAGTVKPAVQPEG